VNDRLVCPLSDQFITLGIKDDGREVGIFRPHSWQEVTVGSGSLVPVHEFEEQTPNLGTWNFGSNGRSGRTRDGLGAYLCFLPWPVAEPQVRLRREAISYIGDGRAEAAG
jgi:hypothetical protein